jgi:ADP-ribosylglycohydrolase
MSLGISELLLADAAFTPEILAKKFFDVFKRDPRTGYSHRFYAFLTSISSGEEFLQKMVPDSEKSGAAMRAPPLGMLQNIDELLHKTEVQARVTHDTPNGMLAAKASALLTHYFCHLALPKDEVGAWLTDKLGGEWHNPFFKNKIGTSGVDCVHAAVTTVMISDTLTEVLTNSVNFTGDVDTVAAIAMAAASFSPEIINDLSPTLYYGLETTPFGRDYLYQIDAQLHNKFLGRALPPNPLSCQD